MPDTVNYVLNSVVTYSLQVLLGAHTKWHAHHRPFTDATTVTDMWCVCAACSKAATTTGAESVASKATQ